MSRKTKLRRKQRFSTVGTALGLFLMSSILTPSFAYAYVDPGSGSVIVTTILDPKQASKEELADLYRMRWNNETDFSSLKVTLQMDVLRCKTPELVRKEIWAHAIAYNLIRTIMAQSCCRSGMLPREISFKATIQTLEAFQPLLASSGSRSVANRIMLYEQLIQAIVAHQVGNRPGRLEPRLRKRRTKKYDFSLPMSEGSELS